MSSLRSPDPVVLDFTTWFQGSAGMLFRQAYICTRNIESAEDIAQEAAVRIFKAWTSEDLRCKITANPGYACRVVVNCYIDYARVPSRTRRSEVAFNDERHGKAGYLPDDDLRIAVLSLAEDERDAIIFRYYHGLTFAEAGTQLGISPSQARRLHKKALTNLAGLLDEGMA